MKKVLSILIVYLLLVSFNHFLFCTVNNYNLLDFSENDVIKSFIYSNVFVIVLGVVILKEAFKKDK